MSNKELILEAFKKNKNKLYLGQVLKYKYGYKFCSRVSELRAEGYKIPPCEKGEKPSRNLYVLLNPNKKV